MKGRVPPSDACPPPHPRTSSARRRASPRPASSTELVRHPLSHYPTKESGCRPLTHLLLPDRLLQSASATLAWTSPPLLNPRSATCLARARRLSSAAAATPSGSSLSKRSLAALLPFFFSRRRRPSPRTSLCLSCRCPSSLLLLSVLSACRSDLPPFVLPLGLYAPSQTSPKLPLARPARRHNGARRLQQAAALIDASLVAITRLRREDQFATLNFSLLTLVSSQPLKHIGPNRWRGEQQHAGSAGPP